MNNVAHSGPTGPTCFHAKTSCRPQATSLQQYNFACALLSLFAHSSHSRVRCNQRRAPAHTTRTVSPNNAPRERILFSNLFVSSASSAPRVMNRIIGFFPRIRATQSFFHLFICSIVLILQQQGRNGDERWRARETVFIVCKLVNK